MTEAPLLWVVVAFVELEWVVLPALVGATVAIRVGAAVAGAGALVGAAVAAWVGTLGALVTGARVGTTATAVGWLVTVAP